jgi:hypothetical protein
LSWRITEQATIEATYKYTRDSLDIRTENPSDTIPRVDRGDWLPTPPYTTPETEPLLGSGVGALRSFKGDLESHTFGIGLRWAFGKRQ